MDLLMAIGIALGLINKTVRVFTHPKPPKLKKRRSAYAQALRRRRW